MTDLEKLVHNEQVKLLALYLNNCAVACFIGAAISVPLGWLLSSGFEDQSRALTAGAMVVIFIVLSLVFRRMADRALGSLCV